MTLLLGSAVKVSFMTFFEIQSMPAAKPVRVVASMIVFTSLLSDRFDIMKKIFFQFIYSIHHKKAPGIHRLGNFHLLVK